MKKALLLLTLSLCFSCQAPILEDQLPTASLSPVNMEKEETSLTQTLLSPDGSKLAIFKGTDSGMPFYTLLNPSLIILDIKSQKVEYKVALDFNIETDNLLWWQDNNTLLMTAYQEGQNFVHTFDAETGQQQRLHTFQEPARLFQQKQKQLYFVSQTSLKVLDLQSQNTSTLLSFNTHPDSLSPTAHAHEWLIGVRQSVEDFTLQLEPPEPRNYYLLNTQEKTLTPCQNIMPSESDIRMINSEYTYQSFVKCPEISSEAP